VAWIADERRELAKLPASQHAPRQPHPQRQRTVTGDYPSTRQVDGAASVYSLDTGMNAYDPYGSAGYGQCSKGSSSPLGGIPTGRMFEFCNRIPHCHRGRTPYGSAGYGYKTQTYGQSGYPQADYSNPYYTAANEAEVVV
jgi:hypothetical protein